MFPCGPALPRRIKSLETANTLWEMPTRGVPPLPESGFAACTGKREDSAMSRRESSLVRPLPFLAAATLMAAGCGGRKTYPVQGKVLWSDGKPATELAGGMVQFDLVTWEPKEKVSPHATILEDGSYRLTSFKQHDGAPAGKYRVWVVPMIWTEG